MLLKHVKSWAKIVFRMTKNGNFVSKEKQINRSNYEKATALIAFPPIINCQLSILHSPCPKPRHADVLCARQLHLDIL